MIWAIILPKQSVSTKSSSCRKAQIVHFHPTRKKPCTRPMRTLTRLWFERFVWTIVYVSLYLCHERRIIRCSRHFSCRWLTNTLIRESLLHQHIVGEQFNLPLQFLFYTYGYIHGLQQHSRPREVQSVKKSYGWSERPGFFASSKLRNIKVEILPVLDPRSHECSSYYHFEKVKVTVNQTLWYWAFLENLTSFIQKSGCDFASMCKQDNEGCSWWMVNP